MTFGFKYAKIGASRQYKPANIRLDLLSSRQLQKLVFSMSKISKHFPYLDGLRAIAAIYVVLHHTVAQEADGLLTISGKILSNLFRYGHYAVDLFIVLSGYCLMLPIMNRQYELVGGAFGFLKKRAKRILPPYFFGIAISLLLVYFFVGNKTGTHWDISIPVTMTDVLTHVLLIHDFWETTAYKINHSFWSISVECRIYLLFPLLLIVWKRFGAFKALVITVMVCALIRVMLELLLPIYPDINTWSGVNPYLLLFALGMFAAEFSYSDKYASYREKIPWGPITIILLLSIAIISYKPVSFKGYSLMEITDSIVGLFSFSLLVLISQPGKNGRTHWLTKILSWPPLVFTGTFAYSIYLLHAPLIQLIWQYLLKPFHLGTVSTTLLGLVIGTPIILIASYMFFIAFERPFLRSYKVEKTIPTPVRNHIA